MSWITGPARTQQPGLSRTHHVSCQAVAGDRGVRHDCSLAVSSVIKRSEPMASWQLHISLVCFDKWLIFVLPFWFHGLVFVLYFLTHLCYILIQWMKQTWFFLFFLCFKKIYTFFCFTGKIYFTGKRGMWFLMWFPGSIYSIWLIWPPLQPCARS